MRLPTIVAKATGHTSGLSFDEVKRDEIAARFREVMTADVEEDVRAEMVYELHCSVRHCQVLYLAVADELGTRFKHAIRKYLEMRVARPTDEQNFIPDRFREHPRKNRTGS